MWKTKLNALLDQFLATKDPRQIHAFVEDQTQNIDIDATQALHANEVFSLSDVDISMDTLQSMHFNAPEKAIEPVHLSSERYNKVCVLGEGGMATVWQMQDQHLLRTVALKQLKQDKATQNHEHENFVVEAQITAQLQHPGIVPIHDLQVDPDNHQVYFTMREIQGDTLEMVIQSVHRVSETEWNTTYNGWNLRKLIATLANICQTMAYAHSRGVIHQDLKPANIMIGHFGEVLIVDWGVARVRSMYTTNPNWVQIQASDEFMAYKRSTVSGTPRYMAPEQIHGEPEEMDGRVDVYAIGVLLFHILTKTKPFVMPLAEVLEFKKTQSLSLRDWITDNPDAITIPSDLVDICDKALRHHASDRYQSIQELQSALEAWLDGKKQEENASHIIQEVSILKQSIEHLHFEANEIMARLNFSDSIRQDDWWHNWESLQEVRQQIDSINDLIYQKIQGASLYAPHLLEIYDHLVALEYHDYIIAIEENNHRAISTIQRRFDTHLAHLPVQKRIRWNNQLAIDTASLQSRKSGVNVERHGEITPLLSLLETTRWVSILGLAGIGKTHLAWQVASEWAKLHHWQVYFCDVSDISSVNIFLQRLAQSLNILHIGSDPLDLIVRILNRDHPNAEPSLAGNILIIDNAEGLQSDTCETIHTLIERCPNLRCITTTQRGLNIAECHEFMLPTMSLMNSIELFIRHCQYQLPSWSLTRENYLNVVELLEHLDHNPLAIELVAGRASLSPLPELINQMHKGDGLFAPSDYHQQALNNTLQWSFQSLTPLERTVLYQVSVLGKRFRLQLAESIVVVPKTYSTSDILDILTRYNLLNREYHAEEVHFSILNSVRNLSLNSAPVDGVRETQHRLAKYLASIIHETPSAYIEPRLLHIAAQYGEASDATACCQRLLSHLESHGPIPMGLDIATIFLQRSDLLQAQRRSIQLQEIDLFRVQWDNDAMLNRLQAIDTDTNTFLHPTETAITSAMSPFQSSPETTTSVSQNQLQVYIQQHRWPEAMETAVALFHHTPQAERMSLMQMMQTNLSNAGLLRQALGIALHQEELYVHHGAIPLALQIDIAVLYTRLGLKAQAIKRYATARTQCVAVNAQAPLGRITGNLGLLYQSHGDYDEALAHYKDAREIFLQLQDTEQVNAIQGNIGSVYFELAQYEDAIILFDQAIQTADQLENPIQQGVFRGNKGRCLIKLNRVTEGLELLKSAIQLCDHAQPFAAGAFRGDLASCYATNGDLEKAIQLIQQGELQVREHTEQYGRLLCQKADIYYLSHDWDYVRDAIQQVEKICTDLRLPKTSALQIALLHVQQTIPPKTWLTETEFNERQFNAELLVRWGRYEEFAIRYPQSLTHLERAQRLFAALHLTDRSLDTRMTCASIHLLMGNLDTALSEALTVQQHYEINGDTLQYGRLQNFLGKCYRRMGKLQLSLQSYERSIAILKQDTTSQKSILLAGVLQNTGNCYSQLGEHAKALHYLQEALKLGIQNHMNVGNNYCTIATCYQTMGREHKAIEYFQKGIQELKRIGDINGETLYTNNLALIYQRQNRLQDAEQVFKTILPLLEKMGIPFNISVILGNYGILLTLLQRFPEAQQNLERSVQIAQTCSPLCETVFTAALANLYSKQSEHAKAMQLCRLIDPQSLKDHTDEYIKLLCVLSEVHVRSGDREQAKQLYAEAGERLQQNRFPDTSAVMNQWIRTTQVFQNLSA